MARMEFNAGAGEDFLQMPGAKKSTSSSCFVYFVFLKPPLGG